MTSPIISNTFQAVYKDDFQDSDNYYRILFNAGKALQARELTQLQTIIQNEFAKFARNIFVEGSTVTPGGVTVNNRYEFVKLNTINYALPVNYEALVGAEFIGVSPAPQISFKVLQVLPATVSDPATLYIRYTDTSDGTSGAQPIRINNGSLIRSGGTTLEVAGLNATGRGTTAHIAQGDFFAQDHIVFANDQTIIVSKYSSQPTVDLGFLVTQEVVTVDDTDDLYDNQNDAPNIASPGADRYRIRLTLTTRDEVDSGENFIFIAKITNGIVSQDVSRSSNYNQINEVLAKRTKEESGDYVVKSFRAKFDDYDSDNLSLDVSGGIAYVDGYRLDIGPTKIVVPKARDTLAFTGETSIARYGNYVLMRQDNNVGLPNINTIELLNLRNAANYGGSTIGTCRVRQVEKDGLYLRFYLFDIRMNAGLNFRDTVSIGSGSANYANVYLENNNAILRNTSNNSLLFQLPKSRPTINGVSNLVYKVQKRYIINATAGTESVSAGGSDIFVDTGDWVISNESGAVETGVTFNQTGTPFGSTVNVSGLTIGQSYELLALINLSTPTIRNKDYNENEVKTFVYPNDVQTDLAGNSYFNIGNPDVVKVKDIRLVDSVGIDVSNSFIFDNGQRDNFYAPARLVFKTNQTVPAGEVYVRYDYFTHGAGDLFAVNSYNGFSYDEIPDHRLADGTTVSLRDVLDYRPIQDSDGDYINSKINLLPQPTNSIAANVEYYLPRRDQLIVKPVETGRGSIGVGEFDVIQGISSTNPQYPITPAGSMALYNLGLNSYTLNDSDTTTSLVSNKRYTMGDISRLEKRMDRLAEITSLSLLEVNTSSLTVLDSNGLERTKSGFFADNFKDFVFSETEALDYRASLDQQNNLLQPAYNAANVRLLYDSNNNNNTLSKSGDLLLLPRNPDVTFVDQNLATTFINVNPFEVIINTGFLNLSPSSDEWIETEYLPDIFVSGGDRKKIVGSRTVVTRTLGGWFGVAVGAIASYMTFGAGALWMASHGLWQGAAYAAALQGTVATSVNALFGTNPSVSISSNEVVVGTDVEFEQIGSRVVNVRMIPYMRSKKIYFKAQGLRPNTEHFAFFNDVDMSNWVREETFRRFSDRDEDYSSNRYRNNTQHPQGKSRLISNDNGVIEGSLFIPSTSRVKFRTGAKIFKLLDITAPNDTDATSLCQEIFTSAGVLETVERTIKATRVINVETIIRKKKSIFCLWDPIAQSFFVSQTENPSGIFLSKIDGFFRTKPGNDGQPIQCQIRTMENGSPTEWAMPGGTTYLNPVDVNVPSNINDLTSVQAAPTTFEFEEPIYLAPGQEYAVVFLAETTEYTAYVAETYEYLLGSTAAKVAKQPSLGSLFKSQNGTTWTPDQTKDLMFRVWRADFQSTGVGYLENAHPSEVLLQPNPITAVSGSSVLTVQHEGHGFNINDKVTISGLSVNGDIGGISNNSIIGDQVIIDADWTGYTFDAGGNATSNETGGGTEVIASRNIMYDEFFTTVQDLIVPNTAIAASAALTSGASWAADRVNANGGSSAYDKSNSYTQIVLNEHIFNTSPSIIASFRNQFDNLGIATKSATFKLDFITSDTKVSPVVDLQRASLTCIENIIDYQDSASTSNRNIPLDYISETSPNSGSSASKHITTAVTLDQSAVGLKVLFSANRPPESEIDLYYRTSTGDEDITTKDFIYVQRVGQTTADELLTTFREYEYLIGGTGGNLTSFTSFQLKFVFNSTNTSKIPRVKDLRAIALAV